MLVRCLCGHLNQEHILGDGAYVSCAVDGCDCWQFRGMGQIVRPMEESFVAEIAELEQILEAFVIDLERVSADPPPGPKLVSELIEEAGIRRYGYYEHYGRYECPYCKAPSVHFLGCPWHDYRTFYQGNRRPMTQEVRWWTTPEERLAALHEIIRRIRAYARVPCPHCGGSNTHAPGCVMGAILATEET